MNTLRDRDLLLWFFEHGADLCARSSFGALLDRQHALAYDSTGRRVPRADPWTYARSVGFRHRPTDDSYDIDDAVLAAASISRRLRLLAAATPAAADALDAYFGARGAVAARTRFGRLLALVPLTPTGAALVRELGCVAADGPAAAYAALARYVEMLRRDPRNAGRAKRALAEAEHRLLVAWRLWKRSADSQPEPAAPPARRRKGSATA